MEAAVAVKDGEGQKAGSVASKEYSKDELMATIRRGDNPELTKQLLADLDALDASGANKEVQLEGIPDGSAGAVVDQPAAGEQKKQDGDDVVTVRVSKKVLGTYADVEAMAKGVSEKDRYITFLKNDKLPTLEREAEKLRIEAEQLRKERDELAKQQAAAAAAKSGSLKDDSGEVSFEIGDIPERPQGDDWYDSDKRDAWVKAVEEQNKKARAAIEAIKASKAAPAPAPKAESQATTPPAASKAAADARAAEIKRQYLELEEVRLAHPEVFGSGGRSVEEMERDYIGFLGGLAKAVGLQSAYGQDSMVREEVFKALERYQGESEESARFREILAASQVAAPADMPTLMQVYAVREERRRLRNADGSQISAEEALTLARTKHSDLFNARRAAADVAAENRQKALADAAAATPEAPVKSGGGPMTLQQGSDAEVFRLMRKPSEQYTMAEKAFLKNELALRGLEQDLWPKGLQD